MIGKDQDPSVGQSTQFRPGASGNPTGKPKGTKHISTWIQDMLSDPNFVQKLKDGTELKGAPMGAIIKTAIAKAISGDTRAMEWIAKHGWGTLQRNSWEGDDNPITAILSQYGLADPPKPPEEPRYTAEPQPSAAIPNEPTAPEATFISEPETQIGENQTDVRQVTDTS